MSKKSEKVQKKNWHKIAKKKVSKKKGFPKKPDKKISKKNHPNKVWTTPQKPPKKLNVYFFA